MKKIVLLFIFLTVVGGVDSFAQKRSTVNQKGTTTKNNTTSPNTKAATTKQEETTKASPTTPTPVAGPKRIVKPPKDGYAISKEIRDTTSEKAFLAVIKDEDVIYTKRVWRDIDLRDTINGVLNYPKARLIEILLNQVKLGELTAYSPVNPTTLEDDDAFNFPLDTTSALQSAYGTVNIENRKEGTVKQVRGEFNPALFLKYRIKEDWVFDGKRGVFEPRIVGLAPLKFMEKTKEWQPVFWIYYDEARDVLASKRLFNSLNDSAPLTMDDFFVHRLFSSHIVKETNAGDYKVKDLVSDPKQRLLESERIKKKMADFEQGLWEY